MNYNNFLILFACISIVDAGTLRGSRREPLISITVCHEDEVGSYTTITVGAATSWLHLLFHNDVAGSCEIVCEDLCEDYNSFDASANACTCSDAAATDEVQPEEIAETEEYVEIVEIDPVVKCASSPWNPCGPGSACTDTDTGFTCSPPINQLGCPVGCGPNAECVVGGNSLFTCECKEGFTRPEAFLSCVEA